MTTADTHASAPKSSRRQLWLVVAMFFVPLGIAFLMYYGNVGWRPEGSTNKGELIDPARPLPEAALATPSGNPTTPDFLRGKWSIVFVGAGACDDDCRTALTDIRQVQIQIWISQTYEAGLREIGSNINYTRFVRGEEQSGSLERIRTETFSRNSLE